MPFFTIFIPTYNRAHTLLRALDSISAQQDNDLEVVIVDDGSTDNTQEWVRQWQTGVTFPVKYIYQANQGKVAAHNTMLKHAHGELTVMLDSDDLLAENALAIVRDYWQQASQEPDCVGIEGLSIDLENGQLLGTAYPQDVMLSNYLEMRQIHKVTGDKLNVIKTSVLRDFPYPRFEGEKHIPESTVWSRIAQRYRFLHINQVLQRKEYLADGITQAWSDKKTRNPCGYRQFYLEILNQHKAYYALSKRFTAARRYVYLSFLCGTSLIEQLADIDNKLLYLAAFLFGISKYLKQQLKKSHLL